jgi:hypothetical protein
MCLSSIAPTFPNSVEILADPGHGAVQRLDDRGNPVGARADAAYFGAHGITRLERVITDAWAYKWSLRGIIGDRNTYTSIYSGGNGVHQVAGITDRRRRGGLGDQTLRGRPLIQTP